MAGSEGRDPYEDFVLINKELEEYKYRLLERPQIVVANKMDEDGAEENFIVGAGLRLEAKRVLPLPPLPPFAITTVCLSRVKSAIFIRQRMEDLLLWQIYQG